MGWIVGAATLLFAVAGLLTANGYPPNLVISWLLLVPGLLVLPPAVAVAHRLAPVLGSIWAPPLIYVLLAFAALAAGAMSEPHGAARAMYVNRALAQAEAALKANDPKDAAFRMAAFQSDAATNPAVKAMLARIAAADAAQAAADAAAARPSPQQTLAELQRVDAAFQAVGVPCKRALIDLQAALQTGPAAAYQAADAGAHACNQFTPTVGDAVPDPARGRLNADIQACDVGYARIWTGLRHVRGFAQRPANIRKAVSANNDLELGRELVNACLPAYEADLASAGLKRPAPDLAIGSLPYVD